MFRYGKMHEKLGRMQRGEVELGRMRPFKIVGNVYFAGTYQASCHLIDTSDGIIMIDTGYASTASLVREAIETLGFDLKRIKYIINTHWHDDHTGATAEFARLSGAKTLIGRDDEAKASKYFKADILIDDGDVLHLGGTEVRFVHTPGHTKGTVSLFFDTEEDGNVYRVGMFGGAGLNTMVPTAYDFEGCREAYFASLKLMKKEKVDVFIGNHTWNNDTYNKAVKLFETGENGFLDGELWGDFMDGYEKRLSELIANENAC